MRVRIGWIVNYTAICLATMVGCDPDRKANVEYMLAASSEVPSARLPASEYQVLQERPDRLLVELPNRLLVIAQELQTAPVVSVQVWVKTGSIYEQYHAGAGLSHFLEHLVSGGTTENRSEAESNGLLGSIGAQTNAGTGLATVQYYVNTTSAHAPEAIELLSDWMQHNVISTDEFQRERDVIQREFQMGQGDPRRVFWKLTQKARYRFHPARHPTIGYLEEFLRIGRDQVYDFYRLMYVPNNMVFVVVGAIDKQQTVDLIARLWADSKPGDLPDLKFPIEPPLSQARDLTGTADIKKSRLRLAWPATRLGADGDYALDLLAVVLGQGESSRLVRTIRDTKRLVNTVSAFNLSMNWGEGFFGIDCEIAADQSAGVGERQRVQTAILEQVERVRGEGISGEELARAQRHAAARVVYAAQTAEGLAREMAHGLIAMHDPDYQHRYADAVQLVTREQVQQAAQKFLSPDRLITVSLDPLPAGAEAETLTRPDEQPMPAGLRYEAVDLDNAQIRRDLLAADVTAATATIQTDAVRRVVGPSGLRLLVGRNTAVPAVAIQFYQLGGLLADEPGREGVAYAAARMLLRGTTTRSAEAIARQIDDLGARLATTSSYNTQYCQAVCLAEDWPQVMELMADVVLNPAFDKEQWQQMQPRLLAEIDGLTDRWSGELVTRFRQAYYVGHPWSYTTRGRRDVVADLHVEDLRRFHREHLGASEAVLVVVGDVVPDEVIRRAEALFHALPRTPAVRFKPPPVTSPVASLSQFKTAKPLAAVQIGFGPGATRQSQDYAALRVLSNVMSNFPTGWLPQALRGSEGLAYAVWAYAYVGLSPGYFTVVFNTKPQTVVESLSRAMRVVQRGRTEQVDSAALRRAKARVLTDESFSQQSNSDRAQKAALAELYGMGLDEPQRFLQRVQEVDAETLLAIGRKYLNNPVVVVIAHEPVPQAELDAVAKQFGADTGDQ